MVQTVTLDALRAPPAQARLGSVGHRNLTSPLLPTLHLKPTAIRRSLLCNAAASSASPAAKVRF